MQKQKYLNELINKISSLLKDFNSDDIKDMTIEEKKKFLKNFKVNIFIDYSLLSSVCGMILYTFPKYAECIENFIVKSDPRYISNETSIMYFLLTVFGIIMFEKGKDLGDALFEAYDEISEEVKVKKYEK